MLHLLSLLWILSIPSPSLARLHQGKHTQSIRSPVAATHGLSPRLALDEVTEVCLQLKTALAVSTHPANVTLQAHACVCADVDSQISLSPNRFTAESDLEVVASGGFSFSGQVGADLANSVR